MSTFLTNQVKKGDTLEVLPPNGNFLLKLDSKLNIAICAGSGITPILSMIKSSLIEHSDVKFELIYGNKTRNSTMFLDELIMLEKKYNDRFKKFTGFILKKELILFLIQELIRIICKIY